MSPSKNKIQLSKSAKRSYVEDWLKKETPHQRKAFETASHHFDKNDAMDVHTIEALYGKESAFGLLRGKRNSNGPAGDFQMRKSTAKDIGLQVSADNDERFDLNASSAAAAKNLKNSDNIFKKGSILKRGIKAIAIEDPEERKKFDLAAYNAGDARIAKAQKQALQAGEDPTKWSNVQKYLEKAGATKNQAKETRDYVDKASDYEKQFDKKSKANANEKYKKGEPIDPYPDGGHWITKNGNHILIKN